jgi:AraC-like DNA-binding protein
MIERELTASSALVLDLFDGLNELGLLSADDLQKLNISRHSLLQVEERAPVSIIINLWQCALNKPHPANLGLTIGKRFNPLARGLLAHLVSHTENMGDALTLFRDKSDLMSEAEKIVFSVTSGLVRIQYDFVSPKHYHKVAIERSFSSGLTWCQELTGIKIVPVECGFRHSPVDYPEEYQQVFGNNISFNQSQDYMLFDEKLMSLPLVSRNAYLKELLFERAESIEKDLMPSTLSTLVIKTIKANIESGSIGVLAIAQRLNMSRQTLHRKLKKEDTNFSELLTQVRKRLAVEHLSNNRCRIEQLSEKLGYEEPSAFHKAFKTWFNMTPKAYQQSQLK